MTYTFIGANYAELEAQADAHLIAAAPGLLAALHEVLSLCDRDSDIGRVVIAAIAKAKGN